MVRTPSVALLAIAVLAVTSCDLPTKFDDLGPSPRIERISVAPDPASADSVLVHFDGHFEPRGCARISDSGAVASGDTLFVGLRAEARSGCADATSAFRHTLRIANLPQRTLTIHAAGRGQTRGLYFDLHLPLQ